MKIYNSNLDLKNFIKNPTYSVESQKKLFEKILNLMNFNKIIKNFFYILIIKKRIFFFRYYYRGISKINFSQKRGKQCKIKFIEKNSRKNK